MSETLWWLGEKAEAQRLYREAEELKKRFNEAFWMEDEGFFAMGLDAEKRQIKSIGSNPGHCLAAGIVDESLVLRTAGRLVADDLYTGWGIRTLSSKHPAYNPYSYHRGSVWPVEHGTFALGFMRCGLHQHVELIGRAQFEAAALFDFYRLPELFSGHARDADHPFPALYPQANSPQAWSASAVFCFLQAMLGLYPYVPLNALFLDPHLPEWLPEITLSHLCVGDSAATLRFYRNRRIALPVPLLEADVIINACKGKTHHMDPITGAIKNWVGVIGLELRQQHHDVHTFAEYVDIMTVTRPALNVCDAIIVGEGDGPVANTPRWCGCVLASTDPVWKTPDRECHRSRMGPQR